MQSKAYNADASSGNIQTNSKKAAEERHIAKVDQLLQHFYSKSAHIIVNSRLTHLDGLSNNTRSGSSAATKRDRWFNLETDDSELFREELKTWRSITSAVASSTTIPAMIIDVLLDVCELGPNQATVIYNAGKSRSRIAKDDHNILIERWALTLLPAPPVTSSELPTLYKQCIILFRTLWSLTRTLPSWTLSKKLRKQQASTGAGLKIGCRMSTSLDDDLSSTSSLSGGEEADSRPPHAKRKEYGLEDRLTDDSGPVQIENFVFAPIHTPIGSLFLECRYRAQADFGVEDKEALLSSRFLNEDFFKKPSVKGYKSSSPHSASQPSSMPPGFPFHRERYPSLGTRGDALLHQDKTLPTSEFGSIASRHGHASLSNSTREHAAGTASCESHTPSIIDSQEGAFITASSLSRTQSRTSSSGKTAGIPIPSSASDYQRLPFSTSRTSSSSYRSTRLASSPQPMLMGHDSRPSFASSGTPRFSSSSVFGGPSSSLRYTSLSRYDGEGGGSSPGRPSIHRYSSSKYARSLGHSSNGSTDSGPVPMGGGLACSPAFGPESLGRRSRLGSSSYGASKASPSSSLMAAKSGAKSPGEIADINSFLEMIDHRPDLVTQNARSTLLTKSEADFKLKALATSVSALDSSSAGLELLRPTRRLLHRQSIEEERQSDVEDALEDTAKLTLADDAFKPKSPVLPLPLSTTATHEPQPFSYPRYEQANPRKTLVQKGFFTHSASTSPERKEPDSQAPSVPDRPLFPRYVSNSRFRPFEAGTSEPATSMAAPTQVIIGFDQGSAARGRVTQQQQTKPSEREQTSLARRLTDRSQTQGGVLIAAGGGASAPASASGTEDEADHDQSQSEAMSVQSLTLSESDSTSL